MAGKHRIVKTQYAESKDYNQLPMADFLKHIEEITKIPGVEIIQGVIEFNPKIGWWSLHTQGALPFSIGGEPYQDYDGIKHSKAYEEVRNSLGPDEIPRL